MAGNKAPGPIALAIPKNQRTLYYPIRHWHQKLVAIGQHTYRTLESYNWQGSSNDPIVSAASRGNRALYQKDKIKEIKDTKEGEVDLEDENTIVVALSHSEAADNEIRVSPHNPHITCSLQRRSLLHEVP